MSLASFLPAPLNKVFDKDDEKSVVKGETIVSMANLANFMRFFF